MNCILASKALVMHVEFETVYIIKEYPHWTGEDAIADKTLKMMGIESEPHIRVVQTQQDLEHLSEQDRQKQQLWLSQHTESCKRIYFQKSCYYLMRPSPFGTSKACIRSFVEGPFSTKHLESKQELYDCKNLEQFIPIQQVPFCFERVELVNYGICDAVATLSKTPITPSCIIALEKIVKTSFSLFKQKYKTQHYFDEQMNRDYTQAITKNYLIRVHSSDWERHANLSAKDREQAHVPQYPTILLSVFGKPGSFDDVCSELQLQRIESVFKNKQEQNLRLWHERKYGLAYNFSFSEYGHHFDKHFSSGKVII